MTPRHIALVQTSFERIRPILEPAVLTFYDRLFELDPTLRSLFRQPRQAQAQKLAQSLTVVVKGLENPARLRGAIESLGRRHAGYGVRDHHYTPLAKR
jgi:hemoglobin-like flavoprotein